MPIRILCLHGMAINGQIFESQTAAFRSLLPDDYEFTFVDGPYSCKPDLGIASVYPGPYLCWYRTPTTESVTRAHQRVRSIMAEKGPFDGVMGFSQVCWYCLFSLQASPLLSKILFSLEDHLSETQQGAAVAVSMILHHQLEHPSSAPLFRFAIFIGSPLPFSHSLMHGIDTRSYFGVPYGLDCRLFDKYKRPNKVPGYLITPDRYLKDDSDDEGTVSSSSTDEEESPIATPLETPSPAGEGVFYQMFHSTADEVRMNIPTVHIFGRKDPWYLHSKDVLQLACPENASVLEHCYGHEVPRHLSEEICDLIESAVVSAEAF
ncbi:hypothetical protein CSOJ01_07984 [Colletotrichum sojae]|uniref:Serine hydrolase domain-containing protein n=1 Tax=Colletotrichum sojae TaxID=2175907 RepID=A0A8H6MSR4_9PEZI|nr:hypothetical protein CSOJ01_07984 [Colletotrichum sojae]